MDVLYSGLVPRLRVLYPCHEHFLRRAEYILTKINDLSSLVSLYKEAIIRAGSLLIGQKNDTPAGM